MSYKNLFFITLLGTFVIAQLPAMTFTRPTQAQETVYLFDFHDVVAVQDRSIAYRYVRQNIHPLYFCRVLGSLALFGLNRGITFNKKMLCSEYAMLNNVKSEQYINYVMHIFNPFTLSKETLDFTQQLKDAGSLLFLFSNIGQRSFNFMGGREHIDPLCNGKYICTLENNWTTKKSPEAFKILLQEQIIPQYQAKHGTGTFPKRIVMIDDSSKKLAIAQKGLEELQALHPELTDIQFVKVHFTSVLQMKTDIQLLATA